MYLNKNLHFWDVKRLSGVCYIIQFKIRSLIPNTVTETFKNVLKEVTYMIRLILQLG